MPPQNKQQVIAAALATPESDVTVPTRRKSTSFNAQVVDLSAGETASRAVRIDDSLTVAHARDIVTETKENMRNNLKKVTQRARETTGGEYVLEVTDTLTNSRNWFVIGLITRIA